MSVHAVCITVTLRPRDQKWNQNQCFGSMETGGARVPLKVVEHSGLSFLFLYGLPREFPGAYSLGQGREKQKHSLISLCTLWEISWCRSQRKLHLSILDHFGENVLTLFLATVARSNTCSWSWKRTFVWTICFCYCHSGQSCCENWFSLLPRWVTVATPDPAAIVDRAATARRDPVRWHGLNGSATFYWFWTGIVVQVLQVSFVLSLFPLGCCLGEKRVL